MPLDAQQIAVTPGQAEILKALRDAFGYRGFSADAAMRILQRTNRASVIGTLSNLVKKGALCRPLNGSLYAVDVAAILAIVQAGRAPVEPPPPAASAPGRDITVGPIRDVEHALAWLKLFGIPVKPAGACFKIDNRMTCTAEQLVIVTERRRTNSERYKAPKVRIALPTAIPEPSAELRMRGR